MPCSFSKAPSSRAHGSYVSKVTPHDRRTFSQSFLAESSWEKMGECLIPSTQFTTHSSNPNQPPADAR